MIAEMRENGWSGPPLDVVRWSDGSHVALSNTRLYAAQRAGLARIQLDEQELDRGEVLVVAGAQPEPAASCVDGVVHALVRPDQLDAALTAVHAGDSPTAEPPRCVRPG